MQVGWPKTSPEHDYDTLKKLAAASPLGAGMRCFVEDVEAIFNHQFRAEAGGKSPANGLALSRETLDSLLHFDILARPFNNCESVLA